MAQSVSFKGKLWNTVSAAPSPPLKASPPQASTFEELQLYTLNSIEHGIHLTWGGLVLMALLCSGDYSVGQFVLGNQFVVDDSTCRLEFLDAVPILPVSW